MCSEAYARRSAFLRSPSLRGTSDIRRLLHERRRGKHREERRLASCHGVVLLSTPPGCKSLLLDDGVLLTGAARSAVITQMC